MNCRGHDNKISVFINSSELFGNCELVFGLAQSAIPEYRWLHVG